MNVEEKIEQYLKFRQSMTPPLKLQSCALLIIDMQNYQVKGTSPVVELTDKFVPGLLQYFVKRVDDVVNPNISRLLVFFRKNKIPVYYTKFACRRMDGKDYAINVRETNELSESTIGKKVFPPVQDPLADIIPELSPEDTDTILLKTTSGTFSSTDLEHQLRSLEVDTIIIVGVLTHACVENTVRIASDLGFRIFVVDDACAGWSPALHDAALRAMEILYSSTITTDETLKILEKQVKKLKKS